MADVKIKISLNNPVKPGQQTAEEIIAELIGQGVPVSAANRVFDPISGELLFLDVMIPPTGAIQATAVIAANPGVAGQTPAIPAPLFILNLENLAFSTALQGPQGTDLRGQFMLINMASQSDERNVILGKLIGDGTSNTFADGSVNTDPSVLTHAVLVVDNSNTAAVIIPNVSIIATFDGAQSIAIPQLAVDPDMNIPGAATADAIDFEQVAHYIDAAGKLYLRSHFAIRNGAFTVVVPFRTFEDAIAAGAIGG